MDGLQGDRTVPMGLTWVAVVRGEQEKESGHWAQATVAWTGRTRCEEHRAGRHEETTRTSRVGRVLNGR